MRISLQWDRKNCTFYTLFPSPQAADFHEFHDGSAPKWLLGCTATAEFDAKKGIDVVRNTPPEIHVDIIVMGLYNTCCAWAEGTFFPVVVLCQFLVLAGNRFWLYILMYLEYNTVVVSC
jgi:hypothetical protein